MNDSQYKKFRLGNIFIFAPLTILIISAILKLPAELGNIKKNNKFYRENDMKTLNISAPNNTTIKATVEQNNKIIHSEEI